MTATVWSRYRKTEVIGMCQVGRWWLLHLICLLDPYWWGGSVPDGLTWLLLDSPLDPPSRFLFREGWSKVLCASSYAEEDDSLGPPSAEGWQFFWPWCQMVPSFCLSFPHQGQWVTPVKWQSVLGWCMPMSPITFGDSKVDTAQKNLRPLGRVLSA